MSIEELVEKELKSFRLLSVVLEPEKGAEKGECYQEALKLAMSLWCNVKFCFNGEWYKVLINDLEAQISKSPEEGFVIHSCVYDSSISPR